MSYIIDNKKVDLVKLCEDSRTIWDYKQHIKKIKSISWGMYVGVDPTKVIPYSVGGEEVRVIAFKVRSQYHNGWVYMSVGGDDLFRLQFMSTHKNLKHEVEGLYLEDVYGYIFRYCLNNEK